MRLTVGDHVKDVYTGRTGKVLWADEDTGRCTVDVQVYKITGCQSWFVPVKD